MKHILLLASLALTVASCTDRSHDYDATGTFEATEITVSAKATGELKTFDLTEGQELTAGEVVGAIDAYQLQQKQDELTATERQLEANASATQSRQLNLEKQLASLAQQISYAEQEEKRFEALVRDGASPRKQLEDISNQLQVLRGQYSATRDQLRSSNSSLADQTRAIQAQQQAVTAQRRQLTDQTNNTHIIAPISGTVLEKFVERGEFVAIGKPLFKVADTKHMFIRAYLTSLQLKDVRLGQKAKVMASYGEGEKRTYDGVVTWISSRSEFTPKTIVTEDERADLVYAIKILVQNDGYIKIGMYGEVVF